MDGTTSRRQKKTSLKQEKKMAEDLGATVQKNSGATKFGGGDVRSMGETRGEAKYTAKKQYTLRHVDLQKLRAQALMGGLESPVMQVAFKTGKVMDCYAILPWDDYLELVAFAWS